VEAGFKSYIHLLLFPPFGKIPADEQIHAILFFFFLIKNVRPEKLIIAILPGRNYSSTYPLRAAHEGPR
jgi:hypothetical protein